MLELTNEEIEDACSLWNIIEELVQGMEKIRCPPEIVLIHDVLEEVSKTHNVEPWKIAGSFHEIEIQKSLGNQITNTLFVFIYTRWGLTKEMEADLYRLSTVSNLKVEVN